jgi:uncharacterized membrane protein
MAELHGYSLVILSDIGSNSLLLSPDTFERSISAPNRLALLRDWVAAGGGLIMVGGYLSFQGINGAARYHGTPIEEILPVEIHPYDDRVEVPEGFTPAIQNKGHAILEGLTGRWPQLLGFNDVTAKAGAEVLAAVSADYGGKPLLVAGRHGKGRTLAWTSDIGPHWLPPEFFAWKGYTRLWNQALAWLCGDR